jgi:outer membrane protein assembly factor BamB
MKLRLAFVVVSWAAGCVVHGQEHEKQWAYTLGLGAYASSSPALSLDGSTIYIGIEKQNGGGRIIAIPKDGGPRRWLVDLPDWVDSSPTVGPDGTVYVGCVDGKLYAFDGATGAKRTLLDTSTYISSSPAISADGSTIYVGAGDGKLHAVTPSGVEKWTFKTGDVIDASPAIGEDGTVYVGSNDKIFYAVNPDGTERGRFGTGGAIQSSAAIAADGTVYVGSEDQNLYAFNPDLVKKWERGTGDVILASPVIGADGTIYFASYDAYFYALRPDDGSVRWRTPINSTSQSSAAVRGDGVIIVGSDDGVVRAFNPANGAIRWTFDTRGTLGDFIESSPIVAPDGAIYFGSLDGHLYKLNGNGSPLSTVSSWPAFRRDLRHTAHNAAKTTGGRLVNISTRAQAGDGRNLIVGFIVRAAPGQGRAHLIRAVGPGLAPRGVGGFMPDPQLEFFSGQTSLWTNDNWLEHDQTNGLSLSETAAAVQAFPLQPGSADAAILPALPAGLFTAHVRTTDGRPGVALVEVYDGLAGDSSARLLNLSTRGSVGSGENILIAGFVVGGTNSLRLLLRGVGPGLAQFGVAGVLARPTLTLFSGPTAIGTNTGWSNDVLKNDVMSAAAAVFAFPLVEGSADSAMLFDAKPGAYTIQISGVGATTGEAMVEIYVLPY